MVCFIFPELKEVAPFLCKPSLGGCTTPPANKGRQSGSVPRTWLWFMTNKDKELQTSYSMIKLLTGSDNIKAEIYTIYTGAERATSLPLFSESGIKTIPYPPNDTLKPITPLEDATDVTFLLNNHWQTHFLLMILKPLFLLRILPSSVLPQKNSFIHQLALLSSSWSY